VVTDKKGKYVQDWRRRLQSVRDNKDSRSALSLRARTPPPTESAEHYLVLFLTIPHGRARPAECRAAATKFIQSNAAPDHLMAVVEFGGTLRVVQNFTANADLLEAAAKGVKTSYVASNADASSPSTIAVPGLSGFSDAQSDFGARSMLLSIRTLAKNLRAVPAVKFWSFFPPDSR